MFIDRNRIVKLIELSAWERSLKGPERSIREEDVAFLIKAAYDDATEAARAEFMAKVAKYPTSAWPWSAVQAAAAMQPRGGGGQVGGLAMPMPFVPTKPALLILIRGQAESADVDPGNRLPARGTAESIEWEPLHKALDAWDTATILRWIGPQGWVSSVGTTAGATAGAVPSGGPSGGATAGKPAEGTSDLPAPQAPPVAVPLWRQPAVLAAGAVAVVATGVTVYALTRPGDQARLEAELLRRQREAQ